MEAMKSEKWAKHACLMFKHGGLVVMTHNTQTEHAEERACRMAKNMGIKPDVAVVIRIGTDLELKNSKPCAKCKRLLINLGIKRVYFSLETCWGVWYIRSGRIKERILM